MTYTFLPEAKVELNRNVDNYENKKSGLGGEFHGEVVSAIGQIIDHPEMWPKVSNRTRRCLTDRFPYGIIYYYDERQQHILIVAIAHSKRRPDYWKDRF